MTLKRVGEVVSVLTEATTGIVQASAEERRSEEFKALRKGLGYCWSVAVAAAPEVGKPAFEALVGRGAASGDRDLAWVARENLRKRRLQRLDPGWVALARAPLGELARCRGVRPQRRHASRRAAQAPAYAITRAARAGSSWGTLASPVLVDQTTWKADGSSESRDRSPSPNLRPSAVKLLPVSDTYLLLPCGGKAFGAPLDTAQHFPFHDERRRLHRNHSDLRDQGGEQEALRLISRVCPSCSSSTKLQTQLPSSVRVASTRRGSTRSKRMRFLP